MPIRGKLYRARKGEIFGICQGLADWAELPVGPLRLIVILITISTGFIPVIIVYVAAAMLLPVEPLYKTGSGDAYTEDFKREYRDNRKRTVNDLKEEFDKLKRKVAGMEDDVLHDNDKESDWDSRFNKDR